MVASKGFFSFIAATLRSRFGRWCWLVALFLLWVWIWNIPLIRMSYGGVVLPWRSFQYIVSAHRSDAVKLKDNFFDNPGRNRNRFLRRVGFWAVLRSLRAADLSLEDQAIALAIVWQESTFHTFAKNKDSSACGLYQLISATGLQHKLPWWRCMDPVANATAGTALYQRYKVAASSFSERLRCSYLKHYYGRGHNCATDPSAIWAKVGARTVKRADQALRVLREIEREQSRQWIIKPLWRYLDPYIPFGVLVLLFLLWSSRPGSERGREKRAV